MNFIHTRMLPQNALENTFFTVKKGRIFTPLTNSRPAAPSRGLSFTWLVITAEGVALILKNVENREELGDRQQVLDLLGQV